MIFLLLDILLSPFVFVSSVILLCVKRLGVQRMKVSRWQFYHLGLFPLRNHYYEPLFNPAQLSPERRESRALAGIDLNIDGQLRQLKEFTFAKELQDFPMEKPETIQYYYHNSAYESGDAEYLYSMIRAKKPKRIFEIGSGHSTLMAINALDKNREEDPKYTCRHLCIEPYEMSWLEQMPLEVLRKKIEDIDISLFAELEKGDILFIDSTHMVRPQGDVLCEYLEILPTLKPGVIVHIHDIFTPHDYPTKWLSQGILWNEQYILEALLSGGNSFEIIGALNYLVHNHWEKVSVAFPVLKSEKGREPGSFWMVKK
jgi:hypothetical protein